MTLDAIARDGFTVVRYAERLDGDPYALATALLGVEPLVVERQIIRPMPNGRSFASTRIDTPLHTDSQMFGGVSASIQILACVRAAPRGGESVLVDGHRVLEHLERTDPELYTALHDVDRHQRFYFGDVAGPTVAIRGGHHVWTYSPVTSRPPADVVGQRLDTLLANRAFAHVQTLGPGDVLLASNHRMLHGRGPFEGDRELVRLLVWLEAPFAAPNTRARVVVPPRPREATLRLRAVLRLLRGVSPSKVAHEAGIDEPTLYAWRDAFVTRGLG